MADAKLKELEADQMRLHRMLNALLDEELALRAKPAEQKKKKQERVGVEAEYALAFDKVVSYRKQLAVKTAPLPPKPANAGVAAAAAGGSAAELARLTNELAEERQRLAVAQLALTAAEKKSADAVERYQEAETERDAIGEAKDGLIEQVAQLQANNNELIEKLDELAKEGGNEAIVEAYKVQIQQADDAKTAAEGKRDELQRAMNANAATISELKNAANQSAAEISTLKTAKEELERTIAQLQRAAKESKTRITALERELGEERTKVEQKDTEIRAARADAATANESLRNRTAELETARDNLVKEVANRDNDPRLTQLQADLEAAQQDLATEVANRDNDPRLTKLQEELGIANARIVELQGSGSSGSKGDDEDDNDKDEDDKFPPSSDDKAKAPVETEKQKKGREDREQSKKLAEEAKGARLVPKTKTATAAPMQSVPIKLIIPLDANFVSLNAEAIDGSGGTGIEATKNVEKLATSLGEFLQKLVDKANLLSSASDTFVLDITERKKATQTAAVGDIMGLSISFTANSTTVRQFVRALTDDLVTLWQKFVSAGRPYWQYTVVPLLTLLSVAVKNASAEGEIVDALLAEILAIMSIGLTGHSPVDVVGTGNGKYQTTIYDRMSAYYRKDPVIAAVRVADDTSNQFGRNFDTRLLDSEPSRAIFAGKPAPLLEMAFEVAREHDGDSESSVLITVNVSKNGNMSYSLPSYDYTWPAQDKLVAIFGMPIFSALLAKKVGKKFVVDQPSYTDVLNGADYTYVSSTIKQMFTRKYVSAKDDRLRLLPLYASQDGTAYVAPKGGEPTMQQVLDAGEPSAGISAKAPNAEIAMVNFLYELLSLDDIWVSKARRQVNKGEMGAYDPLPWIEVRMAWAYRIVGVMMFSPLRLEGEVTDAPAPSLFHRIGAPSSLTVQSAARPTTISSTLSLVPRALRGTLAKQLATDTKNSADISVYREILEQNPDLAALFDSKRLHTVLVPSNKAFGFYERDKATEYDTIPLTERQISQAEYVAKARADAVLYYMIDGDVNFAKKRGETLALASKKTNQNNISLRLYVAVDNKFDADKGGLVTLSGALDGSRPLLAKLGGRVVAPNGRYHVIDHILDPAVAVLRGSAAGYAPPAAYAPDEFASEPLGGGQYPLPPPLVDQYQQEQLTGGGQREPLVGQYQPAPEQYQSLGITKAQLAAQRGETLRSSCNPNLLAALEASDALNEKEFAFFQKLLPDAVEKALKAEIAARRAFHIYVPSPAAFKAAGKLSREEITPILLAHIGRNTSRVVAADGSLGAETAGSFDAAYVRALLMRAETSVVPSLQPGADLVYGIRAAARTANQVVLSAADFEDRKTSFVYQPEFTSVAQISFYNANPINVHFVNRILLPTTSDADESAASQARTLVQSSTHATPSADALVAEARWTVLVASTVQRLRDEPTGTQLLALVQQLDAQLTDLGGAAVVGAVLDATTAGRQRDALTQAISQNDSADATESADARAAVLDLFDRF